MAEASADRERAIRRSAFAFDLSSAAPRAALIAPADMRVCNTLEKKSFPGEGRPPGEV